MINEKQDKTKEMHRWIDACMWDISLSICKHIDSTQDCNYEYILALFILITPNSSFELLYYHIYFHHCFLFVKSYLTQNHKFTGSIYWYK